MKKYDIVETSPGVFTVTVYDGTKPGEPMDGLHAVDHAVLTSLEDAKAWVKNTHPDAKQIMR